jgi:phenylpropionate dioxygenase-like ring-hydroxylating dioxygenase large terminal subunit
MADDPEPLHDFLAPVPNYLDPLELEKQRYRWYKRTVLPCNWKTALDAFNESYHVQGTHPQMLRYYDDRTMSAVYGRHGMHTMCTDNLGYGVPSPRLQVSDTGDPRDLIFGFMKMIEEDLGAFFTDRDWAVAQRIPDEMPAGMSNWEILHWMLEEQHKAAIEDGPGGLRPTRSRSWLPVSTGTSFPT